MLEGKLSRGEIKPKMLYTIPVFQNPSSVVLSHSNRVRLAALAEKYDFTVVGDEVYQLLSFPESAAIPPPLYYYNSPGGGKCISMNSFSKIVAPGLRLGWFQVCCLCVCMAE